MLEQITHSIDGVQKAVSLCLLALIAIAVKLWFF